MDKKKIKLLKGLSTGLVIVALLFAFLITGIRIFGVQVYGVLTGSMEPSYPTGSLIYVKRVDPVDLRVNDVITFSISPNVIATHRIVEIVPDETNPSVVSYRTKGDANNDVDAALVRPTNVIGKVMFAVPKMGYIANYIQHPPGIYVAIFICGLMIAFVFYTDSLENKQNTASGKKDKRNSAPQKRVQTRRPVPQRTDSRQNPYSRQGDSTRQRQYSRREEYPRESEYRRRGDYSRDDAYSRDGEYRRRSAYSREDAYPRESEAPRRSSYYLQSDYYRKSEYSREDKSSRERRYSRSDERSRRKGYSGQSEKSARSAYSRDSRRE